MLGLQQVSIDDDFFDLSGFFLCVCRDGGAQDPGQDVLGGCEEEQRGDDTGHHDRAEHEDAAAAEDIARICHPHPSMSEVMREAALAASGKRALNM